MMRGPLPAGAWDQPPGQRGQQTRRIAGGIARELSQVADSRVDKGRRRGHGPSGTIRLVW
jgi:hypothetical protein